MRGRDGSGGGGIRRLDAIDEQILRRLERNARLSYQDLGRLVGLSANACRNRVARLERDAIIRGFHADIDPDAMGPALYAIIELRLRPDAHGPPAERFLLGLPGVTLVEHLAGPVHYSVRVRVPHTDALDDLISELQRSEHVESTNTKIVTRRLRP